MFKPVERAYRFVGRQEILLAPSDLREFSTALRREFPDIGFLLFRERGEIGRMDSLGPPTSPPDATAIRIEAVPEETATDALTPTRIVFFDNLAECDSWGYCEAEIVPPGWVPKWEQNSDGKWINTNTRDTPGFRLLFPKFLSSKRRGSFRTEIHAESDDEEITLDLGSWAGGSYPWEDDKLAFLKRVRRIFDRMTTNQYSTVDPKTLAVTGRFPKGGTTRIGRGALEWARARPRHILFRDYKPLDWNPP